MDQSERGQVGGEAAEVYEDFFIPALFGQWPARILELASVDAGHAVLDVGCGTGVLARAAAERVGSEGTVTGVDPNDGMLAVARRRNDSVRWLEGFAEDLPVEDGAFDRVVSQFALMFFEDRGRGLAEMARVLRPDGRVAVATWSSLDGTPGYAAMVELLGGLFGDPAAEALMAPFVLGDPGELHDLLDREFDDVRVDAHDGVARFESIEAWVHTDVRGWTLADLIDDDQYAQMLEAAVSDLARFTNDDGSVEFAAPALIATGYAPS